MPRRRATPRRGPTGRLPDQAADLFGLGRGVEVSDEDRQDALVTALSDEAAECHDWLLADPGVPLCRVQLRREDGDGAERACDCRVEHGQPASRRSATDKPPGRESGSPALAPQIGSRRRRRARRRSAQRAQRASAGRCQRLRYCERGASIARGAEAVPYPVPTADSAYVMSTSLGGDLISPQEEVTSFAKVPSVVQSVRARGGATRDHRQNPCCGNRITW